MSTFPSNTYGASPMLEAVAEQVTALQRADESIDVHTITLVLNGQHGEFDLTVEATDADMEDHSWHGVAFRSGGVENFHEVLPDGPAELTTRMQRERYWALVDHVGHKRALRDARKW